MSRLATLASVGLVVMLPLTAVADPPSRDAVAAGQGGDVHVSVRDGRVSVRAENVSPQRLLQAIARALSAGLEFEAPPPGPVTVRFTDLPLADAIRRIVPSQGVVAVYGPRAEILHIKVLPDRGRRAAEQRPASGSPASALRPGRERWSPPDPRDLDDALVLSLSNAADDERDLGESLVPGEDD